MKSNIRIIAVLLLVGGLFPLLPKQAGTAASTSNSQPKQKTSRKASPSSQEIADAKAKGLVWVNTATHVYHKEGASYGTTKMGKFMTEDDAKKAGFRMAKEPGNQKKKLESTAAK